MAIKMDKDASMLSGANFNKNELEYVTCNLCGSSEYVDVANIHNMQIVRCKKCGLIYRNPRRKEFLNREFYSQQYYGNYTKIEEGIALARIKLYREVLRALEREGREYRGTILDVGCGQGHFLKLAKDKGWEVHGVEVAKSACEYAKARFNIDVKNLSIEDASFPEESFDVITLWNVLDHLCNPMQTLKFAQRLLKKGGLLIARVPNVHFHLFIHKIYPLIGFCGNYCFIKDPSLVVNYGFSRRTLYEMTQRAGFQRICIYNSPLSQGDPYQSFKAIHEYIIDIIKSCYFVSAELISSITFGRTLISSSILAYATK